VKVAAEESQGSRQVISRTMDHSVGDDSEECVMIVIEGETWYGCKVCGKRFQQRNMFMRHHSQLHVGESVVSGQKHSDDERGEESLSSTGTSTIAPYCSYSDGGKSADEIFPYQCMLCRKCFDECGKLRIHVQRHDDVQKRLKCSVCSKT